MPNYQKMYATLFNRITDLISELQDMQILVEEMYMEQELLLVERSLPVEEAVSD